MAFQGNGCAAVAQNYLKGLIDKGGFHRHSETSEDVLADRPIAHKAVTVAYEALANPPYAI